MNPPSQPAPQTRAFQSWQLVFITVMLLAAVTWGLYIATVQAESNGAITGLTLTSDAPGTLTVSWDAASPTPTDYRVDWAKSDEDYQSWKVDEGHVYPAETATTATIADLEHDTEYKIRMRARYYRGEHEGKSWGGPWATDTITVAGEPAETPTPEPVEEEPVEDDPVEDDPVEQPPRDDPARDDPAPEDTTPPAGTIDTITATDDVTGQLLLTWTAPAAPDADPTDYHLNWAKSAEDYPADTAEAGNAHPTGTTHTLTGLEYDTEYNIRVRARYTDGENADSPWNGPWTETTAQVKLPLPAAPFIGATAVSPDGEVLLSWFNLDEDDSITGYQILRGPDADSLVVIEDDTGSSSTSYTDETPPVGQTHTYAVKARNASGLSDLSNTLTATVPTVEEEEELVSARHEDSGNTLVSNLGQAAISTEAAIGPNVGSIIELGMAFTTGNNPFGYHATSVQVEMRTHVGGDTNPTLSIRTDNGGVPSETVLYTLTTSTAITSNWNLVTFTTADETTLHPNTRYWLHAANTGTTRINLHNTDSNDEDTESNVGWQIGNNRYARTGDGTWDQQLTGNTRMQIRGHAAPEFLVSNLDSPRIITLLNRKTDADRSKFAQAFSAANNENGTPAEFDFHGVTVRLQSAFTTTEQLADSDILVTVHSDTDGQPGDLVHTLTPTETYTVPLHSSPVTFSAPSGSTLSSGITYWVKFEIAPASTFFTGIAAIYFEFANDNNEVQGPTTYNRWSIDNNSLWSPESLSWTEYEESIKITVLGAPRYAPLVSNYGQVHSGGLQLGAQGRLAQSFMTPNTRPGQQYRLGSVRISAGTEEVEPITVDLYSDDDGLPGTSLVSMFVPDDFVTDRMKRLEDFVVIAPLNTLLSAGTQYWIVVGNEHEGTDASQFSISTTESKAEDSVSLNDWTIGDRKVTASSTHPSWQDIAFPLRMEVSGTPTLPRTDEADGPDLPGAGHNAHQTGAVVIPGIVSTGHLTAGLDYDYGQTGDFWWLDTERGHSYRIEVEFGDNQRNNTGGSAWTYFIEGDRRGTCCESDHNRDDGFTFVHLKHGEDDRDRRYLIDVAAFDKLNYSSRIYNGPYTITMTDITGTDEVASNLHLGTRTTSNIQVSSGAIEFAVSFTTGDHPGGYYKLDRVRMHVPRHGGGGARIGATRQHVRGSGGRHLRFPRSHKVQHHRPYAVNPLPVTFRAEHCGRDGTLAANTTYWMVLGGYDYFPVLTDSNDQKTSRSGWTIGDVAAIDDSGSWNNLSGGGTIPVEIWASPAPPPNGLPAGVPLIHGERRVGETLTADITGITDPEGLSDPRFTYSWIRGDGVDEESITSEESDTYTLTDDAAGERIKILVTFYDDDEEQETAVGPATSVIVTTSRTLNQS